jgi:RNA polymerase sigma factor (sigma-70 family)
MIDEALVDRCRRGERTAQHEIYTRTAERVYRLLLRITRSPEDARDLAQNAYVRAFTRITQFDGHSSFYTWLCRIAINEALQLLRRKEVARAHRDSILPGSNHRDSSSGIDARLDVEEALAELPPLDRTMLLLRYQEGMDYQTIAEVTECAPGTVGSRLNRARERIRDLLRSGYARAEENPSGTHPMNTATAADEAADSGQTAPTPRARKRAEP